MDKRTISLSKINVTSGLENAEVSEDDPMIKITFVNVSKKYDITLLHLLWINMDEHEIVQITHFDESITIPICES